MSASNPAHGLAGVPGTAAIPLRERLFATPPTSHAAELAGLAGALEDILDLDLGHDEDYAHVRNSLQRLRTLAAVSEAGDLTRLFDQAIRGAYTLIADLEAELSR